jgi:hypothetical protein
MNKQTQIDILQQRVQVMKTRGETERKGIIAKAERQIRKLQQEN